MVYLFGGLSELQVGLSDFFELILPTEEEGESEQRMGKA